ncbi:MAG: YqhA family protein [Pseudomonadota bacterium]
MPKANAFERRFFQITRLFTLIGIVSSLAGAVLMFYLGAQNTVDAFLAQLGAADAGGKDLPADEFTIISLMLALDRFLIGVVFLFFGYGVYGLFVRPDRDFRELGLPDWLHVDQIGQLKQTLAEVIVIVLFVLFLRVALEAFHGEETAVTLGEIGRFLMLPVAIALLAGSLRLVELHPKPRQNADPAARRAPRAYDPDAP